MPGAVNLGTAYASLELRVDRLEAGKRDAQRQMDELQRGMKQRADAINRDVGASMSRLGTTLSMAVSAPIIGVGVAAVRAATQMDSLKRAMVAVSGSSGEAERQMRRLREVAKLPGLGFKEAIQGSVNLQAAGMSARDAQKALQAFGNAIATVGGGKAELERVINQLTQLRTRTSGFGEDIRQLRPLVPQLGKAIQAAFGTADTEAISKMGVTGKEFVAKIIAELEKLPKVTGGIQNAFENFSDASFRALSVVGNVMTGPLAGAMNSIAEKMETFESWFRTLPTVAQAALVGPFGLAASIGVAVLAVGKLVQGFQEATAALAAFRASAAGAITLKVGVVLAVVAALGENLRQALEHPAGPSGMGAAFGPTGGAFTPESMRPSFMAGGARPAPVMSPGNIAAVRGMAEGRLAGVYRLRRMRQEAGAPLNRFGQYTRLEQRLQSLQAREQDIEQRLRAANTSAERNRLGQMMLAVRAEEAGIQKRLEAYDPEKQAAAAKKAAEKRREVAKRNAQLDTEGLQAQADILKAEGKLLQAADATRKARQRKADQDYMEAVNAGANQQKAFRTRQQQRRLADAEFATEAKRIREGQVARTYAAWQPFLANARGAQGLEPWVRGQGVKGFMESWFGGMSQYLSNRSAEEQMARFQRGLGVTRLMKSWFGGMNQYLANRSVDDAHTRANMKAIMRAATGAISGAGDMFEQAGSDLGRLLAKGIAEGIERRKRDIGRAIANAVKQAGSSLSLMREVMVGVADELYGAFSSQMERLFGGMGSLGRIIAGALTRFLNNILNAVVDAWSDAVFRSFERTDAGKKKVPGFGLMPGAPGPGLGIPPVFGPFGKSPGGMIGGTIGAVLGGPLGAVIGGALGGIFRFAGGGPVRWGVPALVGEHGPEVFVPGSDGRILPNHALATTGGITIIVPGLVVQEKADIERLARAIARHTRSDLRITGGRG